MVGLTNLISRDTPMPPKLNRRRALFVLAKIDQILAWEREVDAQRDTRFVELGRYLCEVRAGQYWRLENLKYAAVAALFSTTSIDFRPRRHNPCQN